MAIAALAIVGGLYAVARLRTGLSCSADSGYYFYYAARLREHANYAAGDPMYAPGFPVAIALAMWIVAFPGQAAAFVLGTSFLVSVLSFYVATRLAGARPTIALLAGVAFTALPSVAFVYGHAWTEGLMTAVLLATILSFDLWQTTDRPVWFWLAWLGVAIAPLVKFAAVVAPLSLAGVSMLRVLLDGPRIRTTWRRPALFLAALLPFAAHLLYNRTTKGVFTGHSSSHLSFSANLDATRVAVGKDLPRVLALVIAPAVLGFAWGTRRRTQAWWSAFTTGVICVAYTVSMIWGASAVAVDRLDHRLVSTSIALLLLFIIQSFGVLTTVIWWQTHRCLRLGAEASVAVLLVTTFWMPALVHARTIGGLLWNASSGAKFSVYEAGFGSSPGEVALAEFYTREIQRHTSVSLTFVELGGNGRVHREWFGIASALSRPPVSGARLISVSRDSVMVEVPRLGSGARIEFLAPSMPEQRRPLLRGRGGVNRARVFKKLAEERTAEVVRRIVRAVQAHGLARHWLLVSSRGSWMQIPPESHWDGVTVKQVVSLKGYTAYELVSASMEDRG